MDLNSLGLEGNLDDLVRRGVAPWHRRTDGSVDPFAGKKPGQLKVGYLSNHPDFNHAACDQPDELFINDAYLYVGWPLWYVDISPLEQGRYPCFYDHGVEDYLYSPTTGGPYIDAVYSHGVWSYVANFRYFGENPDDEYQAFGLYGLTILWSLKHCTLADYPYTVYMDKNCLYFMNKDPSFPNDYINAFNLARDMHLIYP